MHTQGLTHEKTTSKKIIIGCDRMFYFFNFNGKESENGISYSHKCSHNKALHEKILSFPYHFERLNTQKDRRTDGQLGRQDSESIDMIRDVHHKCSRI